MTSTATAISTDAAPAAIGPYSQGVAANGFVYVSGQLPIAPGETDLVGDGAAAQARRSIGNIEAVLAAAGAGLADVVRTTVLLADMADFAEVNAVYAELFTGPVLPARTSYAVAALPRGARVEIDAIAMLPA